MVNWELLRQKFWEFDKSRLKPYLFIVWLLLNMLDYGMSEVALSTPYFVENNKAYFWNIPFFRIMKSAIFPIFMILLYRRLHILGIILIVIINIYANTSNIYQTIKFFI